MSEELKELSAWVILGGYVILIVGLAWLWGTRKSRRQSRDQGYERGYIVGEHAGYRRYAAEIDGSVAAAVEVAQRIAKTQIAESRPAPKADWGDQDGLRQPEPEPAEPEKAERQ